MPKECPKVKTGREYPFGVRKVPWDALWHVQYYMRTQEGKLYRTWDRVEQREAMRASKKLVNQDGELSRRLLGLEKAMCRWRW